MGELLVTWSPGRLITLLGLLCLAGCAGDQRLAHDPLLGAPPARPLAARPSAPPATALVPTPPPYSLTSNAALAAGAGRVLDSAHELRIGEAPEDSASRQGQGASAAGAILRRPEPLSESANRNAPSPFVPTASSRTDAFEQMQAQLMARGMIWQRLEKCSDGKEWKFSCSLPSRHNPSMSRTYEAQAPDGLSAMRAVLEQIDKER